MAVLTVAVGVATGGIALGFAGLAVGGGAGIALIVGGSVGAAGLMGAVGAGIDKMADWLSKKSAMAKTNEALPTVQTNVKNELRKSGEQLGRIAELNNQQFDKLTELIRAPQSTSKAPVKKSMAR